MTYREKGFFKGYVGLLQDYKARGSDVWKSKLDNIIDSDWDSIFNSAWTNNELDLLYNYTIQYDRGDYLSKIIDTGDDAQIILYNHNESAI